MKIGLRIGLRFIALGNIGAAIYLGIQLATSNVYSTSIHLIVLFLNLLVAINNLVVSNKLK